LELVLLLVVNYNVFSQCR